MEINDFLIKYNELNNKEKDNFSRVITRLLDECFLLRDLNEDSEDYYFIMQANIKELIDIYLSFINKKLMIKNDGIIAINNDDEIASLKFNKRESVIILILKLLYLEKIRSEISLDSSFITISLSEINKLIDEFGIYRYPLTKSQIEDSLKVLKDYKILNYLKEENETKVEIYNTINYLVSSKDIDSLIERIKNYKEFKDETNNEG